MTVELDRLAPQMCDGKKRFTAAYARTAAAQDRERSGEAISPYRCLLCHHWHVGHVPSMEFVEQLALAIRGLPPVNPNPTQGEQP